MGKDPVYKRGSVWWHRDPVTKRRLSTGFRNKKAALAHHAKRELEAANPHHAAQNEATLGEWLGKMIRDKRATKAEGTAKMYEVKAGHLARVFGEDFSLARMTAGAVDLYILQRREEGAKQTTIYRETVALTQALKMARRAKAFSEDPRSLLPTQWAAKYVPRKRNLTFHEAGELLIKGVRDPEHQAWSAFVLCTGARFSEAERHEPADYDEVNRIMQIRGTKTEGSARGVPVLPMFDSLWDVVLEFWRAAGRAPRWARASKGLPEAAERAGIERVTPNDLRRTHASWLIQAQVDQALVSRVLGHKDGTMVARVYGQVTPIQLANLVRSQARSGTPETQLPALPERREEIQAKNAKAPWRNGRRGGFKILSQVANARDFNNLSPLDVDENRYTSAGSGTKETHLTSLGSPGFPGRLPPWFWLSRVAGELGVLPMEREPEALVSAGGAR